MKIAIVGVGALGSVYALRLSHVAPVEVVVRELSRAPSVIHGERASGPAPHGDRLSAPVAVLEPSSDVDVVLVAVRVDQLDDALLGKLAAAKGPEDRIVVVLAPLLPPRFARAKAVLCDALVVAMPGVVSYEPDAEATPSERRVRYWTPKTSPTTLEDRPAEDARRAKVHALVEAMRSAGLPADVARDVRGTNAATTLSFFPILTGIAVAGTIQRLLDDDALIKLGLAATKEAKALAKTVGELPSWASLFFSFASPFTVRAGIKLGRSRAPEVITFLEKHFGAKLRGQNEAMLSDIVALANEKRIDITNLRKLASLSRAS